MNHQNIVFAAPVWVYQGKGAWFFVTLPKEESDRIKFFTSHHRRGWGSVRVEATIGKTMWQTSIFPDSKAGTYILPLKADIRKKEGIEEGDNVDVMLVICV